MIWANARYADPIMCISAEELQPWSIEPLYPSIAPWLYLNGVLEY